jgi:YVTN family beta-propeller protein
VTPDGLSVLVTQQSGSSVSVISTATNSITATIAVGASPESIAVGPNGQYAYVSTRDIPGVDVINLLTESSATTAPMQAFGRVDGGACVSGAPSWADWPGIGSLRETGWGASWAQWPNNGTGGFVCVRQPIYTSAGTWSIR